MEQSTHRRSSFIGCCIGLAVAALVAPAFAADKQPIKTQHIAEAGPDFHVQGEYVGSLLVDGEPEMVGLHVIARGSGQFEARGYRGGLPGAGWDGSAKKHLTGKTEGKRTTLSAEGDAQRVVIRNGRARVRDENNKVIGRLERVIRKSPTLGAKPPEGAVVIFDGTSLDALDAYQSPKDKAAGKEKAKLRMTPDGFLQLLGGSKGIITRQPFGACKLHIEFRLPFEPEGRGQGRGNSGCYLQGRYEVQILDSFGLEGEEHECGGVYSSGKSPRVNMCFPPLSWQTYDVEFTPAEFDAAGKKTAGARLTVLHNGVEVYRDLDLSHRNYTTAAVTKDETSGPSGHYLQDHGHELWYRNIWALPR